MAKISIDDIKQELESQGWKLLSNEYKNLDTDLEMECPEGHRVLLPWKRGRKNLVCPVCAKNQYKDVSTKVVPKKGKIRVLALDQASHDCGFAVFDDSALTTYGIYTLPADEEHLRINRLKHWLYSMIDGWKPDYIAIEGIQYQDNVAGAAKMGITVFQTLARLQGVLIDTCVEFKVPFEVCPTNTWRSHCGVKGQKRADRKRSMQLLAKQWYDITISNDEADAIGIGKYLSDKVQKTTTIEDWE